MWCSRVIGFSEPLAYVHDTFRTLMRSRQKVMSALSVLMRLFAFPRYNITTGWMTAGADGNRRSHVGHPEGKQRPAGRAGRTKHLLNSIKKKEDIPWNLLALRTPLRNWKEPAPA